MTHRLFPTTTAASLACLLAMLLTIAPPFETATSTAIAQQEALETLSPDQRLIWNREWSLYASKYTQVDDEYFACAKYQPNLPSSLGKTARQLVEEYSVSRQVRVGGTMVKDVTTRPILEDAQEAARALPSLAFGEYGHVHSVEVVQVRGPREMIVRDLWLIDADALEREVSRLKERAGNDREVLVENRYIFRMHLAEHQRSQDGFGRQGIQLIGYDTRGIQPGTRWRGPDGQGLEIGIAGPRTISYTREGSSRARELDVVVALPVTEFRGRLTREEFVAMLATRNMTLEQFVTLSIDKKKQDPQTALVETILEVERNRPKPVIESAASEEDKAREQRALEREERRKEREERRKARQAQREAAREKDKAESDE